MGKSVVILGAQWGDDVMSSPATPDEFRRLQAHYPIVFQQNAQGQFEPIVLFGLFVIYGLSGYILYGWRRAKGQQTSVISTSTDEPDERGLH